METTKLKYCLGSLDGTTFDDSLVITESEYCEYLNIVDGFIGLKEDENLFKIVELNYSDLNEKISFYTINNSLVDKLSIGNNFDHIGIDLNRYILNLLSAIRTFLDHKETMLKRIYSDSSDELKYFQSETQTAYEKNFEYRFVYKLRNYAQHCGLPISGPEISSFLNEDKKINHGFRLYFDKTKLLKSYNWGTKVKADLSAQPAKFEVLPIFECVYQILSTLNKGINKKIIKNFEDNSNFLFSLLEKIPDHNGIPYIMRFVWTNPMEILCTPFPLEQMSKITGRQIGFE